ncbi:DUF3515 family protein [Leucobacter luti]|uniref:Uncharacterized protein DUF3515 n=1 Tax=Leucobacter luti TaxID=340320 RepID=A0A4R6RTU8_9MICO|nr:DUF3515 family protein [Leucobacter luti]MCW2288032.1 hypothetical protein [Leucobacter luti]QYM75978.1 DUF3515 domain-containing protein [Leucobacter luti]TCK45806.1 uncharacterized protein DUF3515 [Leucobacter luti]TDP90300.1 uncharacterized protein DUF3515 [Leucobacter luti]
MSHLLSRSTRSRRSAAVTAIAAALGIASLTACAGQVPMRPADDANNPACADVIVRLPETVAEQQKRSTNAQATGAWGENAAVQLVCGVEPTGPTTDTCVNVNGVDWVIDESEAPIYRFEAYGRSPGLAVYVDGEQVSGTEVVVDLSAVAKELPQERQCTSLSDTLDITKQ